MEMTTIKTVAVFAIIFGCFAVLYPKIFHPMFLHLLGMAPSRRRADDMNSRLPPHLRSAGGRHHATHEPSAHMRGGAHPGMRAAAEMKKTAATQQGTTGNKGMMGVILPMYAVGIVIYLIYTLTKVFTRKERNTSPVAGNSKNYLSSHFSDVRSATQTGRTQATDCGTDAALKTFQSQKELEKLLMKAENEDINDKEMTELKHRLMETEAQMSRILQAMEVVQQKVGAATANTTNLTTNTNDDAGNIVTDDVNASAAGGGDDMVDDERDPVSVEADMSSDDNDEDSVEVIGEDDEFYNDDDDNDDITPAAGEKQVGDERNYSSLADEFNIATSTSAEADMTDEVICDHHDADSTVRHRLPTNPADSL